ncbi:hypothetical protein IWX49DRAFT_326143 [Phyllosticta citricarpa]
MAGASFFFFFFFFLVTSLAFLTSYAAIFLVSVITHAAFLLLMRVVWCRCFQLSLCIWHFDERRWFMGLVGVDEGLALAAISLFLMKYIDWGFFFFFFFVVFLRSRPVTRLSCLVLIHRAGLARRELLTMER